jgi:ArsR family transcriptional regulator
VDSVLAALRAAGEHTRLRVLALLRHGELTVGELAQVLGQSQPRVSRHLKLLGDAGLLDRYPEGTSVFYRLAEHGDAAALAREALRLLPDGDATLDTDRARLAAVRRARAEEADAYFRASAADWDTLRSLYVDELEVEAALVAALGEGPLGDVLDVGTGTGRILRLLAPRARRAVGIDLSHAMLGVARAALDPETLPNVQVRHGDMYHLPLPPASADLVVFHQVLHYADDPAAAVAEAARVLRPGGRVVVVDFAPHDLEFLRAEHAHRRLGFTDREVAAWLAAVGLDAGPATRLPGAPLTVCLWTGTRAAGASDRASADGARVAGDARRGAPRTAARALAPSR